MSFLSNLANLLPIGKKEETKEYFFALNIGTETLTAALWVIEGLNLKILETASDNYSSNDDIATVTDKLLDAVLGLKEVEPQKILFGVPNSWIADENLKDEYLKILKSLVKELELVPMAYVATSHALIHFLEKQEGVPTTAILVGFEKQHLTVIVVRAGKLDGVRVIARGETAGSDIEKALLAFTDVETLPSKILIYGEQTENLKSQLLSFSWMSKLSFLHLPKIDVLGDDAPIKSVCLAGGSEINSDIKFTEQHIQKSPVKSTLIDTGEEEIKNKIEVDDSAAQENFGFVVGDVSNQKKSAPIESGLKSQETGESEELVVSQEHALEVEDFEQEMPVTSESPKEIHKEKFNLKRFIPKQNFTTMTIIIGVILALVLIGGAYVFLPKANMKIFVEPKIVERDTQVVADPNQKTVNEDGKIIPGQIIETEVSGSAKDSASGKRQIGDPAKGTIVLYNKTLDSISLSKGTQVSKGSIKFTLDTSVTIASSSASDTGIAFGKVNTTVTAVAVGADGNISSGADITVAGYSSDKLTAKSEGNFSGGTSKDVTVVSSEDTQRLLAKLSSDLRQQAQQKLQEKYPNKKILEEALSEQITSKSYNKNVNDQASEFSLNMTIRYKGTAFDDNDLKSIVSKLVNMQVPDGFKLDISATETQADVSKLEKDGKLIFLARFKAKLIPKIDMDKIKDKIKFKSYSEATNIIKEMENVLGSEINITPALPKAIQRLPILSKNITIEVGLK
ncbi:MAG: hypothetical protein PHE48_00905 [Candidatus Daviesbacteria bacterium]|nr:hypothetical protein [Candidatus Daviesbacteria bacterium]